MHSEPQGPQSSKGPVDADDATDKSLPARQDEPRSVLAWLIKAGQAAVAIAAILTTAFVVWDKVFKGTPAPGRLSASVSNVQVYPGVGLRNYLDSHPGVLARFLRRAQAQGLTKQDLGSLLATPGVTSVFTVSIEGPSGRPVYVTRTLYSATTLARIPEPTIQVEPPSRYVSHAEADQIVDSTWMAYPPSGKATYFVELDLLDAQGQTLATGRSANFRVPAG
jgi:hypothetical protein